MVLIEGMNSSGKSTLINYFKKLGYSTIKPFYPKINQLKYYLHSGVYYQNYFLERYYISELVYPIIKKDRVKMKEYEQFLIEASLYSYNPIILYLRPSIQTIKKNIKYRKNSYISKDEIETLLEAYDLIVGRSRFPVFTYDYQKDNIDDVMEKLMKMLNDREKRTELFKPYLGSGNCYTKNSLMFIGEIPSNNSIGNGFIRSFISDSGSSPFFHKCLYEAGIYEKEMPYFTNFYKFSKEEEKALDKNLISLVEEINHLNPRKIICLGSLPIEKIKNMLDNYNIEQIEHPSFIKRFKSSDYQFYTDKLKKLAND